MSRQNEELLRMQFKTGEYISIMWLRNQGHLSQEDVDELVNEGVLLKIEKDPGNKMEDDKYKLI